MAQNIKTVQGITLANTKTIQGIAIANIKTIQGIDNTSGGAAAWSYSIAPGSTDSDNLSDNGVALLGKVTAGQSGDVTKLAVYTGSGGLGTGDLKIALYDLSFNRMTFATFNGTGDVENEWVELAVTPVAVTSSTVYLVGFICELGNDYVYRYLNGAPANSAFFSFSYTFGTFPPDPFSSEGGLTRNYAVGIYIEP